MRGNDKDAAAARGRYGDCSPGGGRMRRRACCPISGREPEERILENSRERCYHCKSFSFQGLKHWAEKRGVTVLLEGSNRDDLEVYRPGLRAVRELGVQSPLAELDITKAEVRRMAQALGISVAGRPSAPCMATRLPYGTRLDFEVLDRLEEGERGCAAWALV